MSRLKEIISFLASKTLTNWLIGLVVSYYLSVAVWSHEAFGQFTAHISHNNFFRLVFAVFFLNVLIRMLRAFKSLWPTKARFFLQLPLRAGVLLFLFAFVASLNVREQRWLLIGEGDSISIPWERTSYGVIKIGSALQKKELKTDDSRIFDYEPTVILAAEDGGLHEIGAFPPRKIGSSFMHVLNFGVGPGVELSRDGEVVAGGYMALRLTPFGNTDNFEIKPFTYKFYLSIIPSRVIKKGRESAREYDLFMPRYRVQVTKGDTIIAQGETAEGISFDGNMHLRFFTPSDWVLLEIVHDPFLLWFVVGIALIFSGVLLYPFSYITE